jgi:hypothetical protein
MGLKDEYVQFLSRYGLTPVDYTAPIHRYATSNDKHPFLDSVMSARRGIFGVSVKNLFEKQVKPSGPWEMPMELLRPVVARECGYVPGEIFFNTFPTNEFNAVSCKVPSGYLCLISEGFIDLVNHFSFILAAATQLKQSRCGFISGRELIEAPIGRQTLQGLVHIFSQFLEGKRPSLNTPPGQVLKDYQTHLALNLDLATNAFVIAHEWGHIRMEHFSTASQRDIKTPAGNVGILNTSHEEESEADSFANYILCRFDEIERRTMIPLASGGVLFMIMNILLELIEAKLNGHDYDPTASSSTHPSPSSRATKLYGEAINILGDATEAYMGLYKFLESLFRLVLATDISKQGDNINCKVNVNYVRR